jgi:hypothetical protein
MDNGDRVDMSVIHIEHQAINVLVGARYPDSPNIKIFFSLFWLAYVSWRLVDPLTGVDYAERYSLVSVEDLHLNSLLWCVNEVSAMSGT